MTPACLHACMRGWYARKPQLCTATTPDASADIDVLHMRSCGVTREGIIWRAEMKFFGVGWEGVARSDDVSECSRRQPPPNSE